MTENRTRNASRNLIWGVINKTVALLLPFATRTIILYLLGARFLGIGTLFTSVLSFLSLTELGLSSAIVYAMYRPIAQERTEEICALLNFYKKLYRIIGVVMLGIGTLILPFIPKLMNDDAPAGINVYILFYLFLINSVISYFFAGYRSSLLSAHQREDVSTKVLTLVSLFVQGGQIIVLFLTRNFYAYAVVPIVGTLLTNFCYYIVTKKMFPSISPSGKVDSTVKNEIKKRISGLIGTRLNSIVIHSADTIVLSSFIGLTITAQYGNYYTIFNAVCGFIAVLYTSVTAGIGNKLVKDSLVENKKLFDKLSYLNAWIVCFGSTCFLCLYEPFMKIWVGDEMKLGFLFTCLMVLYFFIYQIQRTILTFKDAAGLWYEDKLRPYISMIINLISNIILVQFIGIYGVVLSTIISFLISLPWANKVLFENLFHSSHRMNLVKILKYFVITAIACVATYCFCCICRGGLLGLIERIILCCFIPNIIFVLISFKSEEFFYWKSMVIRIIKRRV